MVDQCFVADPFVKGDVHRFRILIIQINVFIEGGRVPCSEVTS